MEIEQRQQQIADELARLENLSAGLLSAVNHVRKSFTLEELQAAGFSAQSVAKTFTRAATILTRTEEEA